jgi:uncharacterized surface anchored protein
MVRLLDKHYDGADGNGGQNFKWHIDYNNADSNLPAGTKISDTLSDGQEFVKNQFKLVYQDGKPVEEGLYSVQYTDNPAEMTITFPNGLTKAVRISYQSHVIDPIVDGSKTVISNTASSNGKDSDAKSGTITSQGLTKTVNGVDYNTKDVTWKFDINMARQLMKKWSLTDIVPDGLSVDYKSFVLTKHDDPKFTYKEGTDFEVVRSDNGFKVNFLNDLKVNASDWYVLTYKTSFDTSKLPKNGKWTNTATATWTDYNGKEQTNNGSADFTPKQEFRDDGSKSGSYNATTKHITWTVVGNYNQRELKSASITDPILGDQDYIDGSAKVYPATINTNGSYTKAADADASLKPTYDAASKTVSVKLPDGSKSAYVLQFDTSLDGKLIKDGSYSNTATYENDGKSQDLKASISVPNAGNLIEKNGAQDNSNMSYVNWSLLVNKTQSTLGNVKVTDKPTPNQSIDVDSIKVYPTTVDQWGNVTVSNDNRAHPLVLGTDYSVNLTTDDNNQATLTISFLKTISTSYSVEYRSLITSDKDTDKLSNSVTITGENAKVEQTQDTQKVVDVTSGGSADGRNTTIVLTKKDGDTNKALGGAAFELWTTKDSGDKRQLLRAGTTDDNGQLTWKTLRAGKYLLFEKQAPQGYDISADLARGVIVNVAYSQSTDGIIYLNYVNEQKTGSVVLSKTDGDTGKALAGATFALFTKDGTQVKSGLVTDDKGKITVDGLKPGDYYFQESAAPAGYVLNDKRLPFTVVFQSEAKVAAVAATNEQKTGSVVLSKTDGDTGKALAGATFALFTKDGTQVKSGLVTDDKGKITVDGLKPGDYYFQESAAPAGYVLNDKRLPFTVVFQSEAKVAAVAATNEQKTGSVVLSKTDGDTGKALAGATFALFTKDGTQVKSGLVTDDKGKITVDGLKPGDYYFQESAAPAGYVLNDKRLPFTVVFQSEAKVAAVAATNEQKTGSVVLSKTDGDTGKALAGATFALFTKDGTQVKSGLVTDDKGKITVDGLKPGDYYFQESAAPAGYVLNDKRLPFTVVFQSEAKVAAVAATNEQKTGSVVLSKTDGDTGKALAGATFALFTKDGTQVKSGLVTDDKGKITVDGLKPGDYYFQESAAPAGYVLNDKRLPFTVVFQSEAKVAAVAATNEQKTGSVIPAPGKQSSTGTTPLSQTGSAVAVIAGAVVLLSLAGVSLVMVRRRH